LSWTISKFRVRALYDFGTSFKSYEYTTQRPITQSRTAQKVVEKRKKKKETATKNGDRKWRQKRQKGAKNNQ